MVELSRDDLMNRLIRLDITADLIIKGEDRLNLVIVGGGALVLQWYTTRSTHDMDAISVSPILLSLLEDYDINCAVQAHINSFPYNFEDRLVPLFSGRKIDYYTASLEDIVISKLYSIRTTDQQDIELDSILCALDWDLLEKLATDEDEAAASALNDRRYAEFLSNYQNYKMRFGPCQN